MSQHLLSSLLGSSGTIAFLSFAGALYLQFLTHRSGKLAARYSGLVEAERPGELSDAQLKPLRTELTLCRHRLRLLSAASWLSALSVLSFATAILCEIVDSRLPQWGAIEPVGVTALLLGFIFFAVSIVLEASERAFAHIAQRHR